MKILNVWSLHFETFLIEIEGTEQERLGFLTQLETKFDTKAFMIVRRLEK